MLYRNNRSHLYTRTT